MRRLTEDELREIGEALDAGEPRDLAEAVAAQEPHDLRVAAAGLLRHLGVERCFPRRNLSVAVVAVTILCALNGVTLTLEPDDEARAFLARLDDVLLLDVIHWLESRVWRMPTPGARCSGCQMPLREALRVDLVGLLLVPTCGGCGRTLGRPSPAMQEA